MTRVARLLGLALVALSLVGGALVVFGAPASADPRIGLSLDGVNWSEHLTTPLLDPGFVWVPGEAQVATLYVRNQSGQQAEEYAEVTVGPADAVLAADLHVRTRYDGGAWTAGTTAPAISLANGQVVRLDIEVTFDPQSGNSTMRKVVPLDVRVLLRGDDPAAPGPSPALPGSLARPEVLARTGGEVACLLGAAGVLLVAGAWLVTRRRGAHDG